MPSTTKYLRTDERLAIDAAAPVAFGKRGSYSEDVAEGGISVAFELIEVGVTEIDTNSVVVVVVVAVNVIMEGTVVLQAVFQCT